MLKLKKFSEIKHSMEMALMYARLDAMFMRQRIELWRDWLIWKRDFNRRLRYEISLNLDEQD